ncbi:MAG: hypothetical protein LBM00_02980 [Deltaproteobacteria bacterium]|jgi:hypothetical protein|nr:hypothetical protein [Deltaproteobacteria bacterium]
MSLPRILQQLRDHIAAFNAHGAASAAAAGRLILRDANGRAKVSAPAEDYDLAVKKTVTDGDAATLAAANVNIANGINTLAGKTFGQGQHMEYISGINAVTKTRDFNTVYFNAQNKHMFVQVVMRTPSPLTGDEYSGGLAGSFSLSSDPDSIGQMGGWYSAQQFGFSAAILKSFRFSLSLLVEPLSYYELFLWPLSSRPEIFFWYELVAD